MRLITRNGNDVAHRFPLIEVAIKSLPVRSCLIDGEAIVCDKNGLPVFELVLGYRTGAAAEYCAFDLLELDERDLRHQPIENRKSLLAELLGDLLPKISLNEHFEEDGAIVFGAACQLAACGLKRRAWLRRHDRKDMGRVPMREHWASGTITALTGRGEVLAWNRPDEAHRIAANVAKRELVRSLKVPTDRQPFCKCS